MRTSHLAQVQDPDAFAIKGARGPSQKGGLILIYTVPSGFFNQPAYLFKALAAPALDGARRGFGSASHSDKPALWPEFVHLTSRYPKFRIVVELRQELGK